MHLLILTCLLLPLISVISTNGFSYQNDNKDFLLLTVATEETDGFKRYMRSVSEFDFPIKVLGMGETWKGGDMNYPGGGHKLMLLKKALKLITSEDENKIIMFTDSYDVIMLGSPADILEQFHAMDARVVFSAEPYCWPDESLADQYPVTESRYKFLNSGGFIGYASDLLQLLLADKLSSKKDDQLYFTKLYLEKSIRDKHRIKLDHKAAIFQNLNGAADDIDIVDGALLNSVHNTKPLVLHGNGHSKLAFNTLANYLAHSWTSKEGCITCRENNIDLHKMSEEQFPVVVIAVQVIVPTPFIREFFEKLVQLDYPRNKIHFLVYNSVDYHQKDVELFIENVKAFDQYLSVKAIKEEDVLTESDARTFAVNHCLNKGCDYLFSVDSIAHIDNSTTLKNLISLNRTVIAPMLVRPYKAWSNYWGAVTKDGFYSRSFDYMDIVNRERIGVWNVPYISAAYLINATLLHSHKPKYDVHELDPDMSFSRHYRDQGVFMYVSNLEEYGHLINTETFDTKHTNPDVYELLTNRVDWEQRYISPLYPENFNPNKTADQPCPDVYWFPVVTPEFCQSFVEIMENFGQWSDGSNKDPRVQGGYENVPTRDIHMKQVGLEMVWDEFLSIYVSPLQKHVFVGYNNPPRSLMNFVVRYRPDEQPSLKPHHDSSTYTINLALNRPKIDYQGGGCKFLRYNCSVVDTRVGWLLMHPGRLTHFHEGLPVTNGTRYIMISFVDP